MKILFVRKSIYCRTKVRKNNGINNSLFLLVELIKGNFSMRKLIIRLETLAKSKSLDER